MSSMILPLHDGCYRLNYPVRDESSFSSLATLLGGIHIHFAAIEVQGIFVVSTIRGSYSGMWELLESLPRITESDASSAFKELKMSLRAQYRKDVQHGLLEWGNRCSPRKVDNSFIHLVDNQGVSLYMPERDGWVQL